MTVPSHTVGPQYVPAELDYMPKEKGGCLVPGARQEPSCGKGYVMSVGALMWMQIGFAPSASSRGLAEASGFPVHQESKGED